MHKNAAFEEEKIVINYRQKKQERKVSDETYGEAEKKVFW